MSSILKWMHLILKPSKQRCSGAFTAFGGICLYRKSLYLVSLARNRLSASRLLDQQVPDNDIHTIGDRASLLALLAEAKLECKKYKARYQAIYKTYR